MEDLLKHLKSDELVVIYCNNQERALIHSYLDKYHRDIGHVGLIIGDVKVKFGIKCFSCGTLLWLKYHQGQMENNIDEHYSNWCNHCDEPVCWECNYDGDSGIIRKVKNNAICIGQTIHVKKSTKTLELTVDEDMVDTILKSHSVYIIETIPNWKLVGSQGKKGRGKLNRRKIKLREHIEENIQIGRFT